MNSDISDIDFAIIGGGIIGLWSAYSILQKFPDALVVVYEAAPYLGEHSSGRNSEVLHSGLYYAKNSLKHIHCLNGNVLWRNFLQEKKMTFLDCGKVIVANQDQLEKLEELYQRGQDNSVLGLRRLSAKEKNILNEDLEFQDGFYISSAGVLNLSESIRVLQNEIQQRGGVILTNAKASLLDMQSNSFLIEAHGDFARSKYLVNAGGLFAVEFRQSMGLTDYSNYYVKGNYLTLRKKLNLDKLIYPIPPENGLGLGVHLTLNCAGEQKFGPDTEEINRIDYSIQPTLINKMMPAIHKIFKNVSIEDLQLGYAGIRPKVKKNQQLVTDFVINTVDQHKIPSYFEFLGIESPGVTAAPSLAKMLTENL